MRHGNFFLPVYSINLNAKTQTLWNAPALQRAPASNSIWHGNIPQVVLQTPSAASRSQVNAASAAADSGRCWAMLGSCWDGLPEGGEGSTETLPMLGWKLFIERKRSYYTQFLLSLSWFLSDYTGDNSSIL